MLFINLMVNYDQTVPKPHVYINILRKKHQILTESGVETWISQSTHMTKILVHIYCVRFAFKPHFLWRCDAFLQFDGQIWSNCTWTSCLHQYFDEKTSNLTESGVETWLSQSTHGPKYWSIFAVWDLPLNLIFCDNVMLFHQFDGQLWSNCT